jgi:tetratricopeptide (TPR) repeat protein
MLKKWGLTLSVFLLAASPFAAEAQSAVKPPEFSIPVKLTGRIFLPKPAESVPRGFSPPVAFRGYLSGKAALVYPSEIYKPRERVKPEEGEGFFSCGRSDAKTLYAEAVRAFSRGDYRRSEELFEKLLAEYPSSPYTLNAAYYLGYIAFKEGNYEKAFNTFKNLCLSPYAFSWKDYACSAAVVSALKLGRVDEALSLAKSPFWKNYLLWLEGKLSDGEFESSLNCEGLPALERTYCVYVKDYLSGKVDKNLPAPYVRSLVLKHFWLEVQRGQTPPVEEIEKLLKEEGKKVVPLAEATVYRLIENGEPQRALELLFLLKNLDPKGATRLAALLAYRYPSFGKELLRLFPSKKVAAAYAEALYNEGRYREALAVARRFDLPRIGAYAAYRVGRFDEVVKFLSREKEKGEADYAILFDALLRLKDLKRAKEILAEIKKLYPNLYRRLLGWYYYYSGNWKKAAKLLTVPLYRAVALYNEGRYGEVLKDLKNENSPEARYLKAKALLALGKFEEAARVAGNINNPEIYLLKGLALFAEGKYREAARYFEKVSYLPQALLKLADSYYNMSDYDRAKEYYLLYIRRFSRSSGIKDAYMGLVNVYLNTGDPSLASYLLSVFKKTPDLLTEEAKLKLAESLFKNGKNRSAAEIAKTLLKSQNPYIKGKALLLLAQLEPQRAEQYLKEAIKTDVPTVVSEAVVRLANLYIKEGKLKEARKLLNRYGPSVSDIKTLVLLYAKVGEFDRAYRLLEKVIPADNSYTVEAFKIAEKFHRPEFYKLSLNSLDPKIATLSAYRLELHLLGKGHLKEALRIVLTLKLKGIRYEPYYSRALTATAYALYKEGYVKDACDLISNVNIKFLNPKQRAEYEEIKKVCRR